MKLLIKSENVRLEIEGSQIMAREPQKETPINISKLREIWMHPTTILSAGVVAHLAQSGIQVVALDQELRPGAILHHLVNPWRAGLRKWQTAMALSDEGARIAAAWIIDKQRQQLALIETHLIDRYRGAWYEVLSAIVDHNLKWQQDAQGPTPDQVQESYFARLYYKALNQILPQEFRFKMRSRMPAVDPFNALLNYGYGILYPAITAGIQRAGLDPYTGFWHKEKDGHPVLAYDMIEAFRPLVDRILVDRITRSKWAAADFTIQKDGAVRIAAEIRKEMAVSILEAIHEGMAKDEDRIAVMCQQLVKTILEFRKRTKSISRKMHN